MCGADLPDHIDENQMENEDGKQVQKNKEVKG